MWFFIVVTTGVHNDVYNNEKRKYPKIRTYLPSILVVFAIAILIPSKETIYLIAGSEAGEYVVSTPEAQEIITDIHTIIKKQLEGYTSE